MTDERSERLRGLQKSPPDLLGYKYLYDAWGSRNYDDACGPPYYLYRGEKDLIEGSSVDMVREEFGRVDCLVDLGCGSGVKLIPLLKALREKNPSLTYVPVDQSMDFLELVKKNVRRFVPGINVQPVASRFSDLNGLQKTVDFSNEDASVLMCMFGSEICCHNEENETSVGEHLSIIHKVLRERDLLLLSFDPKRQGDLDVHRRSYDGVESHEWFKHIVLGLGNALETRLNMDDFDYVPKWEENLPIQKPWSCGIVHWLRAKKDIFVEKGLVLKAGQLLFMLQSAKPSPDEFNDVLKDNKFQFISSYKNDLMQISLFKKHSL